MLAATDLRRHRGEPGRHTRRIRAELERFSYPRDDALLHQQHPAAGRRHAFGRLPPGADPSRHANTRRAWARRTSLGAGGRRHARGHDRRALGEGAGPEVQQPDQRQARQLRGAARGAGRGRRHVCQPLVRDPPQGSEVHHPEGDGRRLRPGGRPQGARAHPPQGRAGREHAPGQARRLPGARSRPSARSSSSRATAPAAPPSRAATASSRRSCRSRAKSSTSSVPASTACSAVSRSGR